MVKWWTRRESNPIGRFSQLGDGGGLLAQSPHRHRLATRMTSSVMLRIHWDPLRAWQHRGPELEPPALDCARESAPSLFDSYQGGAVRTRTRTVVCCRSATAMNGGWMSTVDARRASTIWKHELRRDVSRAPVDNPDKGCSDANCRTAKGQVVGEDDTALRGGAFEYFDVWHAPVDCARRSPCRRAAGGAS